MPLLVEHGITVDLPVVSQQLNETELIRIIGDFDGVIAGDDFFTKRVLQQAVRLQILSKWGVGMDNIDRSEAARLGIKVTNTPDTLSGEVADVCLGYLVMLSRQLHLVDRAVREGKWPKPTGDSLAGRTLGIVGLGGIGCAFGERALAMGMIVLGFDISASQCHAASRSGMHPVALDELLHNADFISLNCPLSTENRHLINERSLAGVKTGSYLINTARGGLVDEAALIAGLKSGRIAGAALDVFEIEPLPADSPLRHFDQCILGSHNSSNTAQANYRVSEKAVQNLLTGLGVNL